MVDFISDSPEFSSLKNKLENLTGLKIGIELFDNKKEVEEAMKIGLMVSDENIRQFCKFNAKGFSPVTVKKEEKKIEVIAEDIPPYFLFDSLMYILVESNGKCDYEYASWASQKWKDIKWWKFVKK